MARCDVGDEAAKLASAAIAINMLASIFSSGCI